MLPSSLASVNVSWGYASDLKSFDRSDVTCVLLLMLFDILRPSVILSAFIHSFLARDAFVRTNRRSIAMVFVRLSGTGVRCDHTDHTVHLARI